MLARRSAGSVLAEEAQQALLLQRIDDGAADFAGEPSVVLAERWRGSTCKALPHALGEIGETTGDETASSRHFSACMRHQLGEPGRGFQALGINLRQHFGGQAETSDALCQAGLEIQLAAHCGLGDRGNLGLDPAKSAISSMHSMVMAVESMSIAIKPTCAIGMRRSAGQDVSGGTRRRWCWSCAKILGGDGSRPIGAPSTFSLKARSQWARKPKIRKVDRINLSAEPFGSRVLSKAK